MDVPSCLRVENRQVAAKKAFGIDFPGHAFGCWLDIRDINQESSAKYVVHARGGVWLPLRSLRQILVVQRSGVEK